MLMYYNLFYQRLINDNLVFEVFITKYLNVLRHGKQPRKTCNFAIRRIICHGKKAQHDTKSFSCVKGFTFVM